MPSYLVVGGSRGLGLETVRQLIANTNNVVFVIVRNKAGSTFLNELIAKSPSANIHVLEADVVDPPSLRAAATEIAKVTRGTLDNLIHNAARTEQTNMWLGLTDFESDEHLNTEFLEAFKVNVLGVIHSVNAFLPLLRQGSTKKITLIGTGGGIPEVVFRLRISSMAAYGTTKAAMEMVMTKYAVQLEHEGFTVISINPGVVDVSATKKQKRECLSE
ncbi:NAD(P)-binding protein [Daedalea quercina L-15889]|uniref:NAD(P)-binding protein n=1 Tax=Daedalea quercina L-15889 TaxID=1314783 RepID=A0A165RZU6_9APHY|nr:NAD(P)-binding protein [Daedalea quercina L-15889]